AVKQMRGVAGEPVTLTIAREKTDPFDVKLIREVIKPKAAIARMEGDYGYVRLPGFNEKATDALVSSINDLKAKNPKMKGLVLDMRNNPGGLLDQAVGVADVFLDGGEVVSQRGRDPRNIQRYNARPGDLLNGLPVVVLINQGSASAAEIVAGALQDRKRAELVGLTSFGKGSVQTVIPLRGGADGALSILYGDGTTKNKDGKRDRMGSVADERLSRLLWLNYLAGNKVASEGARQNIIDGVMEFVERPVGTVATQVV
ncbi:MAG: hypothetical protein B7X77_03805, partial [Caulobacter sp. 39-67-4]